MAVREVYTDDYSTDPVAGGRIVVSNGTWTYDAANQALLQTTTANATHIAYQNMPASIPGGCDEQADITLVSDPSNRRHVGLFLHAAAPAPLRSGYRIGNLDNGPWQVVRFVGGVETGISVSPLIAGGWTVGQTKTLRVRYEGGDFTFWVGGVLCMTWQDSTYSSFHPGFWAYGSTMRADNLRWENGLDVRDPADDRYLLQDGSTLAEAASPGARPVTVWNGTPRPTKKGQLWLDTTGA